MTSAGRNWLISGLLLAPSLVIVLLIVGLPLGTMMNASFHRAEFGLIQPGLTLENYRQILTSMVYLEIFWKTLATALAVVVVCLIAGFPIAYSIATASSRWRPLLYFIVAAPLLINTVVRTYGWLLVLGNKGVINSMLMKIGLIETPLTLTNNILGVIIGTAPVFMPFMVLSVAASLQAIDYRLIESAQVLGASPFRIFRTITLPLAAPGLIGGSILVFSLMLGAFVNPLLLGGSAIRYLSVSVFTDALVLFNLPRALALSMVLFVVVLVIFMAQRMLLNRFSARMR